MHYLAILILIISVFFTARFWMWLYKNAFWIQVNKKIIFTSLFVWWLAAWTILLYPWLSTYFHFLSFTNNNYNYKVLFTFMWYLNLLIFFLGLILRRFNFQQLFNLFIFDLFFLILFIIFWKLNLNIEIQSIAFYYLFVAYGEEFIKSQLAFSINNKIGQIKSDLLLHHILVAIWFAFWENIVYLIWWITWTTFFAIMAGWISIVIMRGVLWFAAHTFYSSLVGMWNVIWGFMIFIWILLAMWIHFGYDMSLYFDYKIIIPIFIVMVYAWISYIFYKLDRIYIEI